jgi:hypothetical protein
MLNAIMLSDTRLNVMEAMSVPSDLLPSKSLYHKLITALIYGFP